MDNSDVLSRLQELEKQLAIHMAHCNDLAKHNGENLERIVESTSLLRNDVTNLTTVFQKEVAVLNDSAIKNRTRWEMIVLIGIVVSSAIGMVASIIGIFK